MTKSPDPCRIRKIKKCPKCGSNDIRLEYSAEYIDGIVTCYRCCSCGNFSQVTNKQNDPNKSIFMATYVKKDMNA